MTPIEEALVRLDADLRELDVRWALIGGVAVGVRTEPRTTQDLDVVVDVRDDREAERVVRKFSSRGYRIYVPLEHVDTGRLAIVRFLAPGGDPLNPVLVDLLFASSGIEPEIVAAAEELELPPGVRAPVARTSHLIALKALAARPQDLADLYKLIRFASADGIREAREAAALIVERGFGRGREVQRVLEEMIARGSA